MTVTLYRPPGLAAVADLLERAHRDQTTALTSALYALDMASCRRHLRDAQEAGGRIAYLLSQLRDADGADLRPPQKG